MSSVSLVSVDSEVTLVWEKRPTADEEQRARRLLLPPTFLCGVSSDSEAETERPDDFSTELQKLKQAQLSPVCSTAPAQDTPVKPSHDAAAVETSGSGTDESQTDTRPIDLSTKTSSESDSSTATGLSFGFKSAGGLSITELTQKFGKKSFGKKDDNFSWPGAGAKVFESAASQTEREKPSHEAEEEGSDDDRP
ncbi:E3 SUMO-protein ligase RanBP2-like [Puntigrus tetrazona]|uniref:E3 SUMO-protein ligase RanBP2-like n=1 Tax=Puntigrus tetrazona TaxID=1606681 RepID=UPI001C899D2F|nr:E3 SUMO-protein ligase RanBP2-like [Puntigrus tetrazona]